MKTIGLLGGMSWESTLSYYKLLNEGVRDKLGGFHSAKIIMQSVDFDEIEKLQRAGKWDEAGTILGKLALSLEKGGADFILICTNTMHKIAERIAKDLTIPIIHIASATAKAIKEKNCKKSILLGTRFTMSEDYIKKIIEEEDIKVITPNEKEMSEIDGIIFNELVLGKVLEHSKQRYIQIIKNICLREKDIDSVILGCTEIGLLVKKDDITLQIFDTTPLHVNRALQLALQE